MVHVPHYSPDGTVTTIANQVALSDSSNLPIGFHLHSHGFGQGNDEDIKVTINNGNAAFLQRGHIANSQKILAPFTAGTVDCNNNDTGLLKQREADGLVQIQNVRDFTGVGVHITGSSNEGYLLTRGGGVRPQNNTGTGVLFDSDANANHGSHWAVFANIGDTCKDGLRIKDGWLDTVIGGHIEGADDANATTAANIHITDAANHVTPYTTIGQTSNGAHGVYFDDTHPVDSTVNPSVVRNCNGDGIRTGPNPVSGRIGTETSFASISGDAISINSGGGDNDPTVIPYENTITGSVSLPSLALSSTYYPDGWQKTRTGTATVSAGSTSSVQGFAGRDTEQVKAEVWLNSDPSNTVEWDWYWRNTGSGGQNELIVEEKAGNTSVDVGYVTYRRGVNTNLL
jgi:hypothetical protein